jgi:hypothetical protein
MATAAHARLATVVQTVRVKSTTAIRTRASTATVASWLAPMAVCVPPTTQDPAAKST